MSKDAETFGTIITISKNLLIVSQREREQIKE